MTKKRKDRRPAGKPEKPVPEPKSPEAGEPELMLPQGFTDRMRSLLTEDEYREFLASYH